MGPAVNPALVVSDSELMLFFYIFQLKGAQDDDDLCRVEGCRQYGKNTKRISRHLKRAHSGMTRVEHNLLPPCKFTNVIKEASTKQYMKYRRPEKCQIHGCSKYGEHFACLTKHLKVVHDFSRKQYQEYRFVYFLSSTSSFTA